MATIPNALTKLPTVGDDVLVSTWTPLTFSGTDDGLPVVTPGWADRSVQVQGTFGASGSVSVEGSNDGVNYHTLRDPQGVSLTFTAAGLKAVLELTRFIRPRVTAGDGTTALTVTLVARRGS